MARDGQCQCKGTTAEAMLFPRALFLVGRGGALLRLPHAHNGRGQT